MITHQKYPTSYTTITRSKTAYQNITRAALTSQGSNINQAKMNRDASLPYLDRNARTGQRGRNRQDEEKYTKEYFTPAQFAKIADYDGLKTFMNTAENLTANSTFQNIEMRRAKEDALQSRDDIARLKRDFKKIEDTWEKTMSMNVAGLQLRMREFAKKLEVECNYANKEHNMVQKEADQLVEGINELTAEGVNCQYRTEGLESFVGAAAHILGKNLVNTQEVDPNQLNV